MINGPLKQSPIFQNEACFLYFEEGYSVIISPTERIRIEKCESVLLQCGTYFADIFNYGNAGICQVYAYAYGSTISDCKNSSY